MTIEIFDRQVSVDFSIENDDVTDRNYILINCVEYEGRNIIRLLSSNTLDKIENKLQDKL